MTMADIFGGPTLEDLHELWAKQDARQSSAWQCPGCGTYYAYWVDHCSCQKRSMVTTSSSTTFAIYDGTKVGK